MIELSTDRMDNTIYSDENKKKKKIITLKQIFERKKTFGRLASEEDVFDETPAASNVRNKSNR